MQKEIKKKTQRYGIAAVLLAITLGTVCYVALNPSELQQLFPPSQTSTLLKTFSSYEALRNFLVANSKTQGAFPFFSSRDVPNLAIKGFDLSEESGSQYSTTNIQVAGVDEADIVKTDGEYIYVISNGNVTILRAYPPEDAEVLSKITFVDTFPVGIFVSGQRLTVLASRYETLSGSWYSPYYINVKTTAFIYNIADRANPTLLENFTISGSYFSSRMIGDYVYFVVSQPAYIIYDTLILPKLYTEDGIKEINASEIRYSDASDNYFVYTTFVAWNMQHPEEEPVHETILMGGTSTMYVSLNNIYVTFPESSSETTIYRIRVENSTLKGEAKGKVRGHELNQFSMDEYNDYFRIATTTWLDGISRSNVYVLDMNLSLVGQLENIAVNENMDSARFIGNRCYLSTSVVRRDPFFVISIEDASAPKILGDLKIPGFTRYLHPYDDNHVIGVGIDGNNVKISLFDVTNVSAPINMSQYVVEAYWSSTPVLTEHKAFLFDKAKELMVMPVSKSAYDYWRGAYVFKIDLNNGITLRGSISHQDGGSYWDSRYDVERALYIEDVLYTVSDAKIKLHNLEDLAFIKTIELN
jgi:uncharacterized secreted protein with C-terminal beta-propeller domain